MFGVFVLRDNRDNIGNPKVRTLPWQLILTNNNSASNCLLQCSEFGYNAAGMEYGDECCK
jgi:hypothetical protein